MKVSRLFSCVSSAVQSSKTLCCVSCYSELVTCCVGLLKYLRAFDVPGARSALTKALRLVNSSLPTARGVIVDMFSEVYLSNKV
jgi:hypothetical protein